MVEHDGELHDRVPIRPTIGGSRVVIAEQTHDADAGQRRGEGGQRPPHQSVGRRIVRQRGEGVGGLGVEEDEPC